MITLRISDMTCGRCAGTIARAVAGVDKGARVEVDIPRKLVDIRSIAPEGELMEAIHEAGYTPERVTAASADEAGTGVGCGCGCGPRAAAPVDVAQAVAPQAKSCCG